MSLGNSLAARNGAFLPSYPRRRGWVQMTVETDNWIGETLPQCTAVVPHSSAQAQLTDVVVKPSPGVTSISRLFLSGVYRRRRRPPRLLSRRSLTRNLSGHFV